MFAQKKVTLPPGRHKIIILDEADSMTPSAQQALRRIMEIYSNTTRFALACNFSSKVIEPIQSRCAVLRYTRLSDKHVLKRLKQICIHEDVKHNDEGLAAIAFTADGDMRQAIANLQSTSDGSGFVSQENVFKVCDQPSPLAMIAILESCLARRVDEAVATLEALWRDGYSALDLITTLFRVTKTQEQMQEYMRLTFIREIGFTHMRILEGVQSLQQLSGLLARLCRLSMPADAFRV